MAFVNRSELYESWRCGKDPEVPTSIFSNMLTFQAITYLDR